jgi:hypothetical protein
VRDRSVFLISTIVLAVLASGCGNNQDDASKSAKTGGTGAADVKSAPLQSAFSPSQPASLARPNSIATRACAADKINDTDPAGSLRVAQASRLKITGWALDDRAGVVPAEVFVELVSVAGGSRYYAQAARITKRPDVAKAHNNPAFENSGYDLTADLAGVPAGSYSVRIAQPVAAGGLTCDTGRTVEVH